MNGGNGGAAYDSPSTSIVPVSGSMRTAAPVRRGGCGGGARDRRQAEVDAVAMEDAGEALRHDAADARGPHRHRHVLPGRPGAEVLAGDQDRVARELVAQRRIEALEEVRRHLADVEHVQVLARVEDVGVDVVLRDHERAALDDHAGSPISSAGSTISPATAAAAATQALAR